MKRELKQLIIEKYVIRKLKKGKNKNIMCPA
jgi:hypothetical protein